MCVFVCLCVRPFEIIKVTSIARVEPGKAREWIAVANLRQLKFWQMKMRQMKFAKLGFTK